MKKSVVEKPKFSMDFLDRISSDLEQASKQEIELSSKIERIEFNNKLIDNKIKILDTQKKEVPENSSFS